MTELFEEAGVVQKNRLTKLIRYCSEEVIMQIENFEEYERGDWNGVVEEIKCVYAREGSVQMRQSLEFFVALSNHPRAEGKDDVRQFCETFRTCSATLLKEKKELTEAQRCNWFIAGLPVRMRGSVSQAANIQYLGDKRLRPKGKKMNDLDAAYLAAISKVDKAEAAERIQTSVSQANLDLLNMPGRLSQMPFSCDDKQIQIVTELKGASLPPHPFRRPAVAEVVGAGFGPPPPGKAQYLTLRFPRLVKIHSNRSVRDVVSFAEYQSLARESMHAGDAQSEYRSWLCQLDYDSDDDLEEVATPSKSSQSQEESGRPYAAEKSHRERRGREVRAALCVIRRVELW